MKKITSRALGVAVPDPSSRFITRYPGALTFVVEVSVIVVALDVIAPLKVVDKKFTPPALNKVAVANSPSFLDF